MLQRPRQLPMPIRSPSRSYSSPTYQTITISMLDQCERCQIPFESGEVYVNAESKAWHNDCFKCAQCFCTLNNCNYFNVKGRNYCEYDFKILYAPICKQCDHFIIGKVLKTAGYSWHPECLKCLQCSNLLVDEGIWHYNGKILCRNCTRNQKKRNEKICGTCKYSIKDVTSIRFNNQDHHPYHFKCDECMSELDAKATIHGGKLYCSKCFDQMCGICSACDFPIVNERSILALGKRWHAHHFFCAKCSCSLDGKKHFEKSEQAYCEFCYTKDFMDSCFKCNKMLTEARFKVFSKSWCTKCYACTLCDRTLTQKSKVIELDMKPICRKCFARSYPKKKDNLRIENNSQSIAS